MSALAGDELIKVGAWLYGKLNAVAPTYPAVAPRGQAMPYILYQSFPRPGGGDVEALGSGRILARLRYLIKVEVDNTDDAGPILAGIDAALSGQQAQSGGYTIQNVTRIESFELPVTEGDDTYWQLGGYYDLEVCQGV